MRANNANLKSGEKKILHKELSYLLVGLCFSIHGKLGRFCGEKQYGDALEVMLKENKLDYLREKNLPIKGIDNDSTNRVDYIISGKILLDLKAKEVITKEDYFQMQRYLGASGCKLGIIVNFRNRHLVPKRVIYSG